MNERREDMAEPDVAGRRSAMVPTTATLIRPLRQGNNSPGGEALWPVTPGFGPEAGAVAPGATGPVLAGRSGWSRGLRALVIVAIVLLAAPYALVPLYRVVDPVSTLMLWRQAKGAPVVRTVVPLSGIGAVLPREVIAAEDERFCDHHGIDFIELQAAMAAPSTARQRGGSTLTQQLAKNLFLWQGRSYVRKALEFPLALWIDLVIPKRRQLEIYLNVVQWGPGGEFGAEAASQRAFGKSASSLSDPEAALLAATLPNPVRRNARQPTASLRRLATLYSARAKAAPDIGRCVQAGRIAHGSPPGLA